METNNRLTYEQVFSLGHEELSVKFMDLYGEVKDMQQKINELATKLENIKSGWQQIKESDSWKFVQEHKRNKA